MTSFLSAVCHQVRIPLNGVLALAAQTERQELLLRSASSRHTTRRFNAPADISTKEFQHG